MRDRSGRGSGRMASAVVRNPGWLTARVVPSALLLVFVGQVAHASETVTYTYDALGRLTSSSNSGGVNNGLQTGVSYDAAGNRSNYSMSGAPPPPSLSISNASVTEGGSLVFTVTRIGFGAASANWVSSNGSASSGNDYTAASGTISFAAGETSKTISIATIDDGMVESSETMTVTLSSPSPGATIGSATGTGTINDNDLTPPSFAISHPTAVAEGGTLVFMVTKTGSTNTSYSVNFAAEPGLPGSDPVINAIPGADYVPTSGTLTFAPHEITKTVDVVTINDTMVEAAKGVAVQLFAATGGATITAGRAVGIVQNDDQPPAIFSIRQADQVDEGRNLIFAVGREYGGSGAYSVNYSTADGTALSGQDYISKSGTLNFAPGDSSTQYISVSTVEDLVLEGDETVLINLSAPTGEATIATVTGSGTITDDDQYPPPSFSISAGPPIVEGDDLIFTVTKIGPATTSFSVSYSTANGTAVSGHDYTSRSGILSFSENEATEIITVRTRRDITVEGQETVIVNLTNPTGGPTISISQASGTINNRP